MSIVLRVFLIVCSISALILCIRKIRHSKFKNSNAIVWITGCVLLVFMSIFPEIITNIAYKIGFMSPVNFVYLLVITFLLIQVMIDNLNISELNNKLKDLNHYISILEHENKENNKSE